MSHAPARPQDVPLPRLPRLASAAPSDCTTRALEGAR